MNWKINVTALVETINSGKFREGSFILHIYVYEVWIFWDRLEVQSWVMTERIQHITVTVTALYHPICIRFDALIMDSSLFFVIFDKTGLNDASPANDTWKNHLSVHYCFFRFFLSDRLRLSLLFFPFIIKLKVIFAARLV